MRSTCLLASNAKGARIGHGGPLRCRTHFCESTVLRLIERECSRSIPAEAYVASLTCSQLIQPSRCENNDPHRCWPYRGPASCLGCALPTQCPRPATSRSLICGAPGCGPQATLPLQAAALNAIPARPCVLGHHYLASSCHTAARFAPYVPCASVLQDPSTRGLSLALAPALVDNETLHESCPRSHTNHDWMSTALVSTIYPAFTTRQVPVA